MWEQVESDITVTLIEFGWKASAFVGEMLLAIVCKMAAILAQVYTAKLYHFYIKLPCNIVSLKVSLHKYFHNKLVSDE